MSTKNTFYAVKTTTMIDGHENLNVDRVLAGNPKEAAYIALCNNVYNISEDEVLEQLDNQDGETRIHIEDSYIAHKLDMPDVVELELVTFEHNNTEVTAFIPKTGFINETYLKTTPKAK